MPKVVRADRLRPGDVVRVEKTVQSVQMTNDSVLVTFSDGTSQVFTYGQGVNDADRPKPAPDED